MTSVWFLVDEGHRFTRRFPIYGIFKEQHPSGLHPDCDSCTPDGADEEQAAFLRASEFLRRPFNAEVVGLRISNLLELRDTAIQRNAIESMVDNIPGGVVIFRVGSRLELLYDSKTFCAWRLGWGRPAARPP